MMRSRWAAIGCCFLAALIVSPAWSSAPSGSIPPQPGTINYIEGQASIGAQGLTEQSVGSAILGAGQSLVTKQGRVEVLLTPGIFLRLGDNSSLRMMNPGLADTVLGLDKGRAMVEVTEIRPENNVRVEEDGVSTRVLKPGLYDFDADEAEVRVFEGKAKVDVNEQQVELKGGHQLNLGSNAKLKAQKFDKKAQEDDFYRWSSLRSSYLAEANADAAGRYGGSYGWAPGLWYGAGWYWDPWFDAYTFVPADGYFYSPFGWGFYSPFYVYGAPYFGYGHYYHHFTPFYRPPVAAAPHGFAGPGGGFNRGAVGGFRGAPSGGFHGGGFAGGGFHGGFGGGGRR